MASFGRTRRTQSGGLRPLALLFTVSVLLLLLRNTDVVRVTSSFATALLVPVQRVLADAGVASNRFVQAITEIDRLRQDNADLRAEVDRVTLENVRLREQAIAVQQATRLAETRPGCRARSCSASGATRG